ncbi:hypothetical protein RHAL1_03454 [Beijerinckiaceae bacterium RH AL1]|nr:hypothetical protein RHCH11_RHCH11_03389 [Beijerinckiaceae bacterium RH CH11]VVB48784.1 hypothetical protein RHAL8_03385 [Beijerinckiaceae bacterium RH AL8]VVC56526.1 hypothetical protein RHAL1_03454 [Beijerinckiaceae bacterium RH AL1]
MNAVETFSVTRHAVDPRADGAARTVHVSAERVTIERVLKGVRMKLGVPVSAYRGLVLEVRQPTGHATLTLHHEDRELDVMLASGEAIQLARKARAWSHVLGQPVSIAEACVTMGVPAARRLTPLKPGRRSRFARRRKPGNQGLLANAFAGEREIIAPE